MEDIACSSRWRAISSLPARKSSIACNRSISADERPPAFALAQRRGTARHSTRSGLVRSGRRCRGRLARPCGHGARARGARTCVKWCVAGRNRRGRVGNRGAFAADVFQQVFRTIVEPVPVDRKLGGLSREVFSLVEPLLVEGHDAVVEKLNRLGLMAPLGPRGRLGTPGRRGNDDVGALLFPIDLGDQLLRARADDAGGGGDGGGPLCQAAGRVEPIRVQLDECLTHQLIDDAVAFGGAGSCTGGSGTACRRSGRARVRPVGRRRIVGDGVP